MIYLYHSIYDRFVKVGMRRNGRQQMTITCPVAVRMGMNMGMS